MRVVPRRAVLCCFPGISVGGAGGDWALGHGRHAIHLVSVVLADTVKVDAGSVVFHRVCHVYHCEELTSCLEWGKVMQGEEEEVVRAAELTNCVTPVRNNCGARDSAVDGQNYALNTVWGGGGVNDVEPVFSDNASVRAFIVVVGGNVIVSPTGAIVCGVSASLKERRGSESGSCQGDWGQGQ
jgi:hypothetical protein